MVFWESGQGLLLVQFGRGGSRPGRRRRVLAGVRDEKSASQDGKEAASQAKYPVRQRTDVYRLG